MAKKEAKLIIKARDEASKKFRKIGNSSLAMSGMISRAATFAGLSLGAAGIGKAVKSLISAASDAQEIGSKFNAVFKEESKAALAFSQNLGKAVGRSQNDLKSYLATLQDTFVPLGFARDQAREMSQQLTKLAIDLASFNNKADAEVLKALQSAIVGNVETMRAYGVIINQTVLGQELMRMGYKNGVKGATEQQKAQARLNLILKGTSDAQGDAARTSGSYANQVKALKAQIADTSVVIGEKILPSITNFIRWLRDLGVNMKLAGLGIVLGFTTLYEDIKHILTKSLPTVLAWFVGNWREVFETLWSGTKSIFVNLYKNAKNFFKAIWAWVKGDGFDFKWTGMLEGFESTIKEMPKIAARGVTGIEKELTKEMAELMIKRDKKEVKAKVKEKGSAVAKVKDSVSTMAVTGTIVGDRKEKQEATQNRFFGLGSGKTVDDKIEENTRKQLEQQKESTKAIKDMVSGFKKAGGSVASWFNATPQTNLGGE